MRLPWEKDWRYDKRLVPETLWEIPAQPDPETGLPRPEKLPVLDFTHEGPCWTDLSRRHPRSPRGEGPALEWVPRIDRRGAFRWFAMFAVFYFVSASVFSGRVITSGGSWISFLTLSSIAAVAIWAMSVETCAGAQWFRQGRTWVRLYELNQVMLTRHQSPPRLTLSDSSGHHLVVRTDDLLKNPGVHALVYIGIIHSVRNGARINEHTFIRLGLHHYIPITDT